ncbi:phage tail tape measure C-terminal domain-containing protein [Hyphomonas sp. NPDC076900]|uniref:phage tail tape measure C-terminal domain-containing protein n=1 Tax=unclassified Hyphomonas TaxID=2630699 RepID=UPI003D01F9D6
MNEFERELGVAGDALRALSDGPGREAAEALGAAFDGAGQRIEAALGQAARSGELDFRRMADGILRELARVAAEAVILRGQGGSGGVNATFNFAPGTEDASAAGSAAGVAAVLARMVQAGGRFS